jgi:hypothetical protein
MDEYLNNSDSQSMGDPLGDLEEQLIGMMKATAKIPEGMLEEWQAFSSAINWHERWIQGLIAFHIFMWILIIISRRNMTMQSCMFLVICGLVYASEPLNTYCRINWPLFATQNYFDEHGVFAGIMFAGPLLLLLMFQLVGYRVLSLQI